MFVNIITAMIVLSAFVAIIPGVPVISLLVGVQVVNGVLLPINLFFIWRLARSRSVMGERRSRGAARRRRRRDRRGHLDALARRSSSITLAGLLGAAVRCSEALGRSGGARARRASSSSSAAPIAPPRSPSAGDVHVAAGASRRTGAAASPAAIRSA